MAKIKLYTKIIRPDGSHCYAPLIRRADDTTLYKTASEAQAHSERMQAGIKSAMQKKPEQVTEAAQ